MAEKLVSAGREFWRFMSAIKTGVILLITVVIVSAAGTLILQRPLTDPEEIQRAYPAPVLRLLDLLGLTNIFHAWWFILLLLLVSLSIVAASIERFPNAWRYFARPYKSPDETFRKGLAVQKQIPMEDEESGLVAAERVLQRRGFKLERVVGEQRLSLFGERHRISEMAVYVVHASLLLIFLGGIVDGLWGWRGFVAMERGQQIAKLELRDGGSKQLPFTLRCDGAGQENYSDGSPKRWWSDLAVLEAGRELFRKQIAVNEPLVYRGIRFYQASYGSTGKLDKLLLTATRSDGKGQPQEISLGLNETAQLDADVSVRLARFIPDYFISDGQVYTRSERPDNPAVQMFVTSKKSGKSVEVWLPALPGFAHNAESPYALEARDLQLGYFTGLQVSYEPGQWGVWTGLLLMAIGMGAAFYVVHARIWAVPLRDARGRMVLWVGGTANKNREAFQQKFAEIAAAIEAELSRLKTEPEASDCKHATTVAGD